MIKLFKFLAAPLLALSLAACNSGTPEAAKGEAPATTEQSSGQDTQATTQQAEEDIVYLDLKDGRVTIRLRPDLAPKHVARIKTLTGQGFYDGIVFHRVIDGFMAQVGCPHGIGTGGSSKPDLKAEFNEEPHVRGTCSMARAQNPDSANSQFFICFEDAPFLNRQYTVWGQVIEGMENVDQIKRGEPVKDPDSIVSMKVASAL
mgnify:CR=1 FL=1